MSRKRRTKSRSRILALDLGLTTGWAFSDGRSRMSGVQDFSPRRGDSRGMIFRNFRLWLVEMFENLNVSLVVYEKPYSFRSGQAYEILYGLSTRVLEECDIRGIDYFALTPSELKRFALGRGRAGKEEMLSAARRKFHKPLHNHNEADALFLLKFAEERYK